MKHRERLWKLAGLTVYTAVSAVGLYLIESTLWLYVLVLFGVPMLVMTHTVRLRVAPIVIGTLVFGTGILLIDAMAHLTGAWYVLSPWSWRLFGVVSFESIVFTVALVWYYLVVYEYFFDDNRSAKTTSRRSLALYILPVGLVIGVISLLYDFMLQYAFAWLLGLLLVVVILCASLSGRGSLALMLKRTFLFAVAVLPLSLVYEVIMLGFDVRFFAFPTDYLFSFQAGEYIVPIEEIVLLLAIPFSITLLYELYLDDAM